MDVLYVDNDHVVELTRLRDSDGSLVSGAAVEATLFDADGVTPVSGAAWPLTLVYTGVPGTYRAEFPSTLGVAAGRRYKLSLSAEAVGKRLELTRNVQAEVRYS